MNEDRNQDRTPKLQARQKRGHELRGLDDNDLKQVPVLAEGTRLRSKAGYLAEEEPHRPAKDGQQNEF